MNEYDDGYNAGQASMDAKIELLHDEVERLRAALKQIIAYADGSTDPGILSVARAALR